MEPSTEMEIFETEDVEEEAEAETVTAPEESHVNAQGDKLDASPMPSS